MRIDGQYYEIAHPLTGESAMWSGERIKAYEVNNRVIIQDYVEPKKKRTYKRKKKLNG